MIIVLQVAGVLAVLVGLVTIGVGIPVKEFSFGNTLIVAGTVGLCTGLILLGLSVVAMELRLLARRFAGVARAGAEPRAKPTLPAFPAANPAAPAEAGPVVPRESAAPAEPPGEAPPWHEDAGRPRGPEAPPESEPAQPASARPAKPRRNLLFQSSVRKDRERPAARPGEPAPADFRAPPPAAPPVAETVESPPANFEDAWPRPDRPKAEPPPRRASRPSPAAAESSAAVAAAERAPPVRTDEPAPAVTVLKSGVVDGMAYSLYSDGSIEAQMPEGMMRFASIDELRAHLDQRQ